MQDLEISINYRSGQTDSINLKLIKNTFEINFRHPQYLEWPLLSSHIIPSNTKREIRILAIDDAGIVLSKSRYPATVVTRPQGSFDLAIYGKAIIIGLPKRIFDKIDIGDEIAIID